MKHKYKIGDVVTLKIGDRPLLHIKVIELVNRKGPHYKLNWEQCAYHPLLNTIAIPERVLNRTTITRRNK